MYVVLHLLRGNGGTWEWVKAGFGLRNSPHPPLKNPCARVDIGQPLVKKLKVKKVGLA